VIAVQIDLDTPGLTYQKWGGKQRAKSGDWLVNNQGDTYTVDGEVFARTYRAKRPGLYIKTTTVWAEVATQAGKVKTKEGLSSYKRGDYIVYNRADGSDGYCMTAKKFKEMYAAAKPRGAA
jgi:hypothetical protein